MHTKILNNNITLKKDSNSFVRFFKKAPPLLCMIFLKSFTTNNIMMEFPREGNKMLITSTNKNGEANLEIAQVEGHKHKKNCKLKFKFKRLDITK